MSRAGPVLAVLLPLALFGLLADDALRGQVSVARASDAARTLEAGRLAALSVRATLAQIEQAVAAGRPVDAVETDRLAAPPARSAFPVAAVPYRRRSRSELAGLLRSSRTTESGLPEAVVARIALGESLVVLGSGTTAPDVRELLLSGRLPVRAEDLPVLARALGVANDPRIPLLQRRLRAAPPLTTLPVLPEFRRRLRPDGLVEGWSRAAGQSLHYALPVAALLHRSGVSERAFVTPRGAAPVPDVAGLALEVAASTAGSLRLFGLRAALWAALLSCGVGLVILRRAIVREAQATARERQFLASVTHELRTPLSAIRLCGETLAGGRGDPRDYGRLVAAECERLEALVERVLALTRLDEAPAFVPVRPEHVVQSAIQLVSARAEREQVALECVVASLPEALWDADAVRRALLNLLDNALRHGRAGGRVRVRAQAEGEHVRLSVSDDGPGIGRRDRSRLFGRFVRGSSEAPGTGLGLHLVDAVARAHGGHVDLVTAPARGSTFTLVLPLVPPRSAL